MTSYSVQPRHWIFVKGYRFLSFAKILSKNIGKNMSSKYSQKLLDHAKQSATDALKTASKKQCKILQKQLMISLISGLPIKLPKPQRIHHKILQRQLKVEHKYLEKDIYFQNRVATTPWNSWNLLEMQCTYGKNSRGN